MFLGCRILVLPPARVFRLTLAWYWQDGVSFNDLNIVIYEKKS